jgi:hypothetical protein
MFHINMFCYSELDDVRKYIKTVQAEHLSEE